MDSDSNLPTPTSPSIKTEKPDSMNLQPGDKDLDGDTAETTDYFLSDPRLPDPEYILGGDGGGGGGGGDWTEDIDKKKLLEECEMMVTRSPPPAPGTYIPNIPKLAETS